MSARFAVSIALAAALAGATPALDAQQTLQADGPVQASLRVGANFLDDLPANVHPMLRPTAATFAVENRGRAESARSLVGYIANGIIVGAVLGAVAGVIIARQSADSDLPIGPGMTVGLTTLSGAVVGGIGGAFVYLMASSSDQQRSPR